MSLVNSERTYSSREKSSYLQDSLVSSDFQSEFSNTRPNPEGFSSSLVLKFEEDSEKKPKSFSKLINVTKILPNSQKVKKMMIPVFFRKDSCSSPKKLFIENSLSESPSNESVHNCPVTIKDEKNKILKLGKVTSTTIGSMHTLSNLDGDANHEIFCEKVQYEYEKELKSSLCEGNIVAFCYKCKKETVCLVRPERSKSFFDFVFCCCSTWSINSKSLVCPTCAEILHKN